jgi:hypothetical protein
MSCSSERICLKVRAIIAYVVGALVGELVNLAFNLPLMKQSGFIGIPLLEGSIVDLILTSILVLPFWAGFVVVANTRFTVYIITGAVLGVLLGSTIGGAMPQMMWDTRPDMDFADRWMWSFQTGGLRFAIQGAAACAYYWLVAVRRWPV